MLDYLTEKVLILLILKFLQELMDHIKFIKIKQKHGIQKLYKQFQQIQIYLIVII